MHDDPQHWASAYDYRVIENVVRTHYHSNEDIRRQMAEIENRNSLIATFEYADNEFSINYNSIKLTADVSKYFSSYYIRSLRNLINLVNFIAHKPHFVFKFKKVCEGS